MEETKMKIDIKKLKENATIPTRGSSQAAGYDLYACIDETIYIEPHKTVKIGTGLAMAIPEGYYGDIRPRSGKATKEGLRPSNTPGTIDSDYRGELIVALHNDFDTVGKVEPNERIAQLLIKSYEVAEFNLVDNLDETERGSGGFGSTGRQ